MRNTIYILLALFICIASFFILHHVNKPTRSPQKKTIDNFIINANFTEYNKDGLVKTKMSAEKVTHFLPENTALFVKPIILTYMNNRDPWHITADQGTSDKTGETIVLQGHVVVHKLPTAKQASITVKTSELTVYPKESRAFTAKPVILSRPGTVIHATGFSANLKTGQYKLLSQSKVIYQPEQQRQH